MKFTAAFIAAVANLVAGTKIESVDEVTPLSLLKIAQEVNSRQTTWTAAVNARFANVTVADVKRQLGTILPHDEGYVAPEVERSDFNVDATIPESFDARTAWPACSNIIGRVRDQSNCGSCWAFGSVEALNDRTCIAHTDGDEMELLSPEDTVSCCTGAVCSFSMGCNGGQPSGAWNWFVKNGVATGGDWNDIGSGSTCKPYSMQTCAHHTVPPEGMAACTDLPTYKTPKCTTECSETAYGTPYQRDRHFAKSSYSIKGEENIQREIMEKGTITVAFSVYEDFEGYYTGVYQHVYGQYLGGHAVKMIGWGVDNGTPYWTCVNSWNDSWGEKGTFRIKRGNNECGIEGSCVAGDVVLA